MHFCNRKPTVGAKGAKVYNFAEVLIILFESYFISRQKFIGNVMISFAVPKVEEAGINACIWELHLYCSHDSFLGYKTTTEIK